MSRPRSRQCRNQSAAAHSTVPRLTRVPFIFPFSKSAASNGYKLIWCSGTNSLELCSLASGPQRKRSQNIFHGTLPQNRGQKKKSPGSTEAIPHRPQAQCGSNFDQPRCRIVATRFMREIESTEEADCTNFYRKKDWVSKILPELCGNMRWAPLVR